jgi:MFS superfamily sulfate permease-like transporter
VRYILGYKVPRKDTLHEQFEVLAHGISGFKWQEFVMGMSMIIFLVALKLLGKRYPKAFWLGALGPISACAISIIAVVAGNLNEKSIKIVEKIPKGGGLRCCC